MKIVIDSKERRSFATNIVANITSEPQMEVLVRPHIDGLTGEQRSFWHVMIRELATLSGAEAPALKMWIKHEVLGTEIIEIFGKEKEVLASSESLNKEQYSDLIEHTYRLAAENGYVLSNPRYREAG